MTEQLAVMICMSPYFLGMLAFVVLGARAMGKEKRPSTRRYAVHIEGAEGLARRIRKGMS